MDAKTITAWNIPEPFHALHMLILREPDGEDDDNRYYRKHLYMIDADAEGGKVLLKRGPRITYPKFYKVESEVAV
ncbi:hypothetical protein [Pseudogemmobacter bohemicus]|uniref:hypothetical protein n=1 Tax=Pseudogemmobacter bohemicus TaxID=2250708 RepID=UPI0013008270|nr:hypothetical protein [Pseudogemmobacter bohemicus]